MVAYFHKKHSAFVTFRKKMSRSALRSTIYNGAKLSGVAKCQGSKHTICVVFKHTLSTFSRVNYYWIYAKHQDYFNSPAQGIKLLLISWSTITTMIQNVKEK